MRAASSAGTTDRSAWSRATLPVNVPDSTRGTCATWATRPGRSAVCGSSTSAVVPADLAGAADEAGERAEQAGLARADLAEQQDQLAGADVEVDVLDAEGAVVVHRGEVAEREGAQRVAVGRGRARRPVPRTRSMPAGRSIRSPPPASALVAFIQARVPGASVTTVPATRPNQSNPLTALATSSAVASSHRPVSSPPQAATTPHWTMTTGTPSSRACTRCSRTAASTRPPSTSRRCWWSCGVAAASLTVRIDSSVDTSDCPKLARAVDAAAAERPATRRPRVEARADATMTASRTAPASHVPAIRAVSAAMTSPLTKSTQRSV